MPMRRFAKLLAVRTLEMKGGEVSVRRYRRQVDRLVVMRLDEAMRTMQGFLV